MLHNRERRENEQDQLLLTRIFRGWWNLLKWLLIAQCTFLAVTLGIAAIVDSLPRKKETFANEPKLTSCEREMRGGVYEREYADYERFDGYYVCEDTGIYGSTFNMTYESSVEHLKRRYVGPPIKIELEEPLRILRKKVKY